MLKAYKYRLYPTDEQKVLFAKTFGCCRFVYNWGLSLKISAYKEKKETLSNIYITNLMRSELKSKNEWLKEVNSQSLQSALRNLDAAYSKFFQNSKAVGFPKYKSRKDRQSFQCPQHCSVDFSSSTVSIPKAKSIPAILHRKFTGKIKTVTISMNPSGRYFASVLVETNITELPVSEIKEDNTIGIDLGIKEHAVCSDGRIFDNPKNLAHSLELLRRRQRQLSRKQKGSANRDKARIKLARIQERISNQRKDHIHKVTSILTHDSQVRTICIEDLNVKGMQQNRKLARSISDASFGMFRSILEYKCRWYGINLISIDRFAPSSKTCSKCGYVYDGLTLNDRSWRCPQCGSLHDRDLNAACNIKNFGLKALPVERGEVKPVDCPIVDKRRSRPKKQRQVEAGKTRSNLTPKPLSL